MGGGGGGGGGSSSGSSNSSVRDGSNGSSGGRARNRRRRSWNVGALRAGPEHPVRIMGIINASPESFYKGSVCATRQDVRDRAKEMEDAGADFVDVGGMSTAPYLHTMISEREEAERLTSAISAVLNGCNLPVSADTCRAAAARAALDAGADIINDISGLKYDHPGMAEVAKRYHAPVILGAYGGAAAGTADGNSASRDGSRARVPALGSRDGLAVCTTKRLLNQSLRIAADAGIATSKLSVDPSIGFFRADAAGAFYTRIGSADWVSRDVAILRKVSRVRGADRAPMPIVVSVSNKSFLGQITGRGRDTDSVSERIHGTVAAEAIAVCNGADIIRTHNVGAAKDAASVASRIVGRNG